MIAACGKDIKVFEEDYGQKPRIVKHHLREITCLLQFEDRVVSSSLDGSIAVWSSHYKLLHEFQHDTNGILNLLIFQNKLISISFDDIVSIWDLDTYELRFRLHNCHENIISFVQCNNKLVFDIEKKMGSNYYNYEYSDMEAFLSWHQYGISRTINTDLGRPVLLADEVTLDYVRPDLDYLEAFMTEQRQVLSNYIELDDLCRGILSLQVKPLFNSSHGSVAGIGVFSESSIKRGEFIGIYGGTVLSEKALEALESDNFLFYINNGANDGIAIDGNCGINVNELKYINHSCDPNATMIEFYLNHSWHVVVIAVRDIASGEELTQDADLTTEDANDPDLSIPCTCNSVNCRKTLFKLV